MGSNENNGITKGGVSATGLLGVAFVVLKLCGVINWSWLWVLSPFWIPLAFVVVALLLAAMGGLIWDILTAHS